MSVTRGLILALVSVAIWARPADPVDLTGISRLAGKPIADAVVWVEAPGARRAKVPEAVLDQRNLNFYPRVVAVQVGTKVKFPNHDRVFHNVFSHHDGTKFDLGLYPVGAVKDIPFDRPGLSRIFCNIHPQMAAYVMVLETPHFAVSDATGAFVIRGIPPGTYPYHAWRPGGAVLNGSIVVYADAHLAVDWR